MVDEKDRLAVSQAIAKLAEQRRVSSNDPVLTIAEIAGWTAIITRETPKEIAKEIEKFDRLLGEEKEEWKKFKDALADDQLRISKAQANIEKVFLDFVEAFAKGLDGIEAHNNLGVAISKNIEVLNKDLSTVQQKLSQHDGYFKSLKEVCLEHDRATKSYSEAFQRFFKSNVWLDRVIFLLVGVFAGVYFSDQFGKLLVVLLVLIVGVSIWKFSWIRNIFKNWAENQNRVQ